MTMSKELIECADTCSSNAGVCKECASACEAKGGMETCVKLCHNCATVCELHANGLLNGDASNARAAIAACEACAVECGKSPSMATCLRCSESCRECAGACKQAERIKS